MSNTGSPHITCIGAATLDAIVASPWPLQRDGRLAVSDALLAGGGPAATAAVALARQGVEARLIAAVGSDDAGELVRRDLAREGVDIANVKALGDATAFSAVLVDSATGARLILTRPVDAAPPLGPSELDACAASRWLHVDQAGWPLVARIRAAGIAAALSVDGGNPIADLDLSTVALYAPTEEALRSASGQATLRDGMAWALEQGARLVVVTRGSEGSAAMGRFDLEAPNAESALVAGRSSGEVRFATEPAANAAVVSTLGAGDVFHGVLLAWLLSGASVRLALRGANLAAALSCAALDGRSAIPDRLTLEAALGAWREPTIGSRT